MHLTSNFMYVLTILYLLFAKLKAKFIGLKTSNQSLRILKLSACKLTQLVPSPSRVVRNNHYMIPLILAKIQIRSSPLIVM